MNLITDKKIAIIGGGPVGLTLASILQQKDANVTVYERDVAPGVRRTGGTLDLHIQSGQRAMEAAGLMEGLRRIGRPTGEISADSQGNILEIEEADPVDFSRPETDRNDLQAILLEALQPGTVIWNSRFQSLEERLEGVQIQFADGSQVRADLVVAADGGMSRVRGYVTDQQARYTGTFFIQGEIENPEEGCPDFAAITQGRNFHSGGEEGIMLWTHSRGDGSMYYDVSFPAPEGWWESHGIDGSDRDAVVAFLHEKLVDWAPIYHHLFDATQDTAGLPLRLFPVPYARKTQAPIALVGDAAHVMPPFGGMGVNMGLVDVLTLVESLEGDFDTLSEAVIDYEQKMMAYAEGPQKEVTRAEEGLRGDTDDDFHSRPESWQSTF